MFTGVIVALRAMQCSGAVSEALTDLPCLGHVYDHEISTGS